jgi:hypothetical protein
MSLLDNLISYWKLDEASGNAIDAHGTNTLTDGNTVGSAAGIINNARDFESSQSESFYISSNATLQTGDIGFTFSFWVKHETVAAIQFYANKSGPAVADREYAVYYTTNQFTFFVYDSAGNIKQVSSGVAASAGVWQHVIAWHDPVSNVIAIAVNNGTPVTTSHTTGVRTTSYEFELGARRAQGFFYDGLMDEVGFWKRGLTANERTALYNGGSGLSYDAFAGGGIIPILRQHYAAQGAR